MKWVGNDETDQIAIVTCPVLHCIRYVVPNDELVRLETEGHDQNINLEVKTTTTSY